MEKPSQDKKLVIFGQLKRVALIAIVVLAVLFLMNLNNRITILYQKKAQRDDMRVEVYQLQKTSQQLSTQIAYATSDVAVEAWARTNGHWVKDGDFPVFPMANSNLATPEPQEETETQSTPENWEVWYELFFGE